MAHGVEIREARPADVPAMSKVLIASIRELCEADHKGDPAILAAWTRNKTPDSLHKWLKDPGLSVFVAVRHGEIAAVGAIAAGGELTLNYVAPDHRFAGLSKLMLIHLEKELAAQGIFEAHLDSTATGRQFYLAHGWFDAGAPRIIFGVTMYPMRKRLDTAEGR